DLLRALRPLRAQTLDAMERAAPLLVGGEERVELGGAVADLGELDAHGFGILTDLPDVQHRFLSAHSPTSNARPTCSITGPSRPQSTPITSKRAVRPSSRCRWRYSAARRASRRRFLPSTDSSGPPNRRPLRVRTSTKTTTPRSSATKSSSPPRVR